MGKTLRYQENVKEFWTDSKMEPWLLDKIFFQWFDDSTVAEMNGHVFAPVGTL